MTEQDQEITSSKGVSRREFITSAAALGAVAGVTTLAPQVAAASAASRLGAAQPQAVGASAVAQAQPSSVPTNWSQTADVVVVGTGLAGLSAAITAHDAGANVLVLEKLSQAWEGGSSRVAMNYIAAFFDPNTWAPDVASGTAFLKAMAAGSVEDETVFAAQAQGFIDNLAMVKSLGGNLGTWTATGNANAPGYKSYKTFCIALPGAPVQSTGYPLGSASDSRLWKLFRDNVSSRNINVLYNTPATELIQDPNTKEILGVQALANNSEVLNIKASRAVILACGGVEFATDIQKQFYPASPCYSHGTPGNTGDGVRMAQKVGADLWHMNSIFPSYGSFFPPGTDPLVPGSTLQGDIPVSAKGVLVNKFGNRFNQGTAVNGTLGGFGNEQNASYLFDNVSLDWDSIPAWAIFDDTARKAGPIMSSPTVASTTPGVAGMNSWFVQVMGGTWSSDNSAEIAKGWILQANDLNTLASLIAADPQNGGKMTGAQLSATIAAYNTAVANKSDPLFLINMATATAINGPPFYAMKIWPQNADPGAGPRRNLKCQIVDAFQQPIPRLYSAGEMGAFWGWLTSSGSHLGECMWTGRVSGNNATAETPWS